jgi:hypothetical protein
VSVLSQANSVAHAALSARIDAIPGGGSTPTPHVVLSDFVISATALTNISGLSISVSAGGMYEFNCQIMYNRGTTSAPVKFGMTFPAMRRTRGRIEAMGSIVPAAQVSVSVPAVGVSPNIPGFWGPTASGSILVSQGASSVTFLSGLVGFRGIFAVSTGGVVQMQAAGSAGTAAITILPGSYVRAVKLS